MVATYTLLGIASARAGSLFGSTLQRPLFVIPFALLLTLLALSELDIVPVQVFARVQQVAQRVGSGRSWFGVVLMGSAGGLVAAPCIGPVLATILGIAASSGNGVWGGALLFSYSLGLGMIFLVLGTFSHLMHRLPRSGQWLNGIKSILAVSLLVIALLFVRRWLPEASLPRWTAALLGGASLIPLVASYRCHNKALRLASAILCALIVVFGVSTPDHQLSGDGDLPLEWSASLREAQTRARESKKNLFVDFSADWCAACKQIDALTLADPAVREELAAYWVIARIDMTDQTEEGDALQQQYGIQGLPTLLFFPSESQEPHPSRVTEFVDSDRLLHILLSIREDS